MQNATQHDFQADEILVSCWGWEQTNYDFYKVVKATAKTVCLRKLKTEKTPHLPVMPDSMAPEKGAYYPPLKIPRAVIPRCCASRRGRGNRSFICGLGCRRAARRGYRHGTEKGLLGAKRDR